MRLSRVGFDQLARVGAAAPAAHAPIGAWVQHLMTGGASPQDLGAFLASAKTAMQSQQATHVVNEGTSRQELFLPGTKLAVPVGVDTVTITPRCDFQCDEFTVPAAVGALFNIVGITIGMRPLFASAGQISASVFAPNSLASRACAGLVRAGTPIDVAIANVSGGPADFFCHFSGSGLV